PRAGSRFASGRMSSSSCFSAVVRSTGWVHTPDAVALVALRLTSMAMKNAITITPLIAPAIMAGSRVGDTRRPSRLELRHAGDDDVADQDEKRRDAEQDVAHDRGGHGREIARYEHVKSKRQQDWQGGDDRRRRSRLRREHAHVPLGLQAVPQSVRDVVQD